MHPFVIGELALGRLRERWIVLDLLDNLPRADAVSDDELLHFIELHGLSGRDLELVDAHLLASVVLTPVSRLWTRDRRLCAVVTEMGLPAPLA